MKHLGRIKSSVTIACLAFALGLGLRGSEARTQRTGAGQTTQAPDPFGLPQQQADPAHQDSAMIADAHAKQSRLRDDERQKKLVSDTEKLLELATALHQDVAKTNKNIMSVDVVKRADEIEKLAHSVKEKMKG